MNNTVTIRYNSDPLSENYFALYLSIISPAFINSDEAFNILNGKATFPRGRLSEELLYEAFRIVKNGESIHLNGFMDRYGGDFAIMQLLVNAMYSADRMGGD